VRMRLVADVPLGALLSGGVDSSLVVALMSQLSNRPIKTFSIGFAEKEFNELPFAHAVAEHCATDHHEMIVHANALEVLPTLVRHYGEPFADSSAIPSYYVAKITSAHVKVALNGDGGDESFAGYERYLGGMLAGRIKHVPAVALRGMKRIADYLTPKSASRRNRFGQAGRFFDAASLPPGQRYSRWMSCLSPAVKARLYTREFRDLLKGHDGAAWLVSEYDAIAKKGTGVDVPLGVDVRSYLPFDLLVKMDIASMACSLEARSPFLDHKVMEFAARLPANMKIRKGILKYLPKKVAARLLPREAIYRRKMGFGVPVAAWMRQELRPMIEETLLSPDARTRPYFHQSVLRQMVNEHTAGHRDHSHQLWGLLWLELWHQEFMA